ncbi:hypothetical protein BGZ76_006056, partial [Entomortierella beljakovae]
DDNIEFGGNEDAKASSEVNNASNDSDDLDDSNDSDNPDDSDDQTSNDGSDIICGYCQEQRIFDSTRKLTGHILDSHTIEGVLTL